MFSFKLVIWCYLKKTHCGHSQFTAPESKNPMDINQSLDWHLDHDFVLMHPWGRQEQRGPCHLTHPFLWFVKRYFFRRKAK